MPELVIRRTVLELVAIYGATGTEDLCSATSRRLGFKRLGAKIRARVEGAIEALAGEGRLERQADGRLGIPPAAVG